jgi:hypothetical protein
MEAQRVAARILEDGLVARRMLGAALREPRPDLLDAGAIARVLSGAAGLLGEPAALGGAGEGGYSG